MMRTMMVVLLLLAVAGAALAGEPEGEALQPIAAAEAEQRTAEARDFLTDLLWEGTEEHWHEGRWSECIRLCRQIVQVDPHFVEAWTGAAWMLWNMDRDDDAIEIYRDGIAANPESYEIPHEFGMYYWQRHKWEQAAEQFRKSVELGAPQALQRMLPNALERAGYTEEALAEWQALLKRFPDDPIAKQRVERLEREAKEKAETV
jgi:tetratricopeptide (TPR) repeat protein